ncbi:MAG: hypothetical protein AB7E95_10090 [Kiritimatiellales bacterium]
MEEFFVFVFIVWPVIAFIIGVLITRWIFRVNRVVALLEEISEKLDDLPEELRPPKQPPSTRNGKTIPQEWEPYAPKDEPVENPDSRYMPK